MCVRTTSICISNSNSYLLHLYNIYIIFKCNRILFNFSCLSIVYLPYILCDYITGRLSLHQFNVVNQYWLKYFTSVIHRQIKLIFPVNLSTTNILFLLHIYIFTNTKARHHANGNKKSLLKFNKCYYLQF